MIPPYPSPLITDIDRRAAAVLTEWMIELGLDRDMLAVAQEGFEHHLAVHRSAYTSIAVEAARKDWERDRKEDESVPPLRSRDTVQLHYLDNDLQPHYLDDGEQ